MSKDNRRLQALTIVLVIVSILNLAIGIGNTLKINTYLDSQAVIIDTVPLLSQQHTEPSEVATTPHSTESATTESTAVESTTAEATVATTETAVTAESTKATGTAKTTAATTSAVTTQTAATSQDNENESFCYVTSSGTKYHKDGCSYLKKSKTQMTVSEAESGGYSPCSRCY